MLPALSCRHPRITAMESSLATIRYPLVLKFPVATLAPYVGLSTEALAWCNANRVNTVADARRTMRPQGRAKVVKCPPAFREEFERLADPPGIPAAWPLHPEEYHRIEQQFAHAPEVYGMIRRAMCGADDMWKALLYLIHFEEDFMRHKGIGPIGLPKLLAWRDEMRQRHTKPKEPLTAAVLKRSEQSYVQHPQSIPVVSRTSRTESIGHPGSSLSLIIHLDPADPLLVQKFKAIKAILE